MFTLLDDPLVVDDFYPPVASTVPAVPDIDCSTLLELPALDADFWVKECKQYKSIFLQL